MFKATPINLTAAEFVQKLQTEFSNKPANSSALKKEFQVWIVLCMYINQKQGIVK